MTARQILCTGSVVRNIIAGRQTQDRRPAWSDVHDEIVSKKGMANLEKRGWCAIDGADDSVTIGRPSPWQKISVGDLLWVREAFALVPETAYRCSVGIEQRANPSKQYEAAIYRENFDRSGRPLWRPSIHMPRWASRITLEVIEVRRQFIQDISEEDALAEGIEEQVSGGEFGWLIYEKQDDVPYRRSTPDPRVSFRSLWNSLYGDKPGQSWADNPEVVAITFRAHMANIDSLAIAA